MSKTHPSPSFGRVCLECVCVCVCGQGVQRKQMPLPATLILKRCVMLILLLCAYMCRCVFECSIPQLHMQSCKRASCVLDEAQAHTRRHTLDSHTWCKIYTKMGQNLWRIKKNKIKTFRSQTNGVCSCKVIFSPYKYKKCLCQYHHGNIC